MSRLPTSLVAKRSASLGIPLFVGKDLEREQHLMTEVIREVLREVIREALREVIKRGPQRGPKRGRQKGPQSGYQRPAAVERC